ncbi:hypothetical protein MVES1_000022 [Malassezia vespertilionis]|uniref:Sm domain-containing protein n=1 Tax=Malassezia vespertilionis TaxID=2020962 RepID=A0A2N1JGQ3_9BASI|nr:uncharacterized protein MVES1_000022 [Malassezia vespertilionis]PKI85709.1 hypothetical protein MVES_000020 [Malassezia vespertilionis]WFD04699.1 hypothetical protein MVES1_000022 [Malassezia vespertilionis]
MDAEQRVRNHFIAKQIRIHLHDNKRAFSGILVSIDSLGNAILHDAIEEQLQQDESAEGGEVVLSERTVPMVMIPGKHIAKVAVFHEEERSIAEDAKEYLASTTYM